jgi:hypothetical protein
MERSLGEGFHGFIRTLYPVGESGMIALSRSPSQEKFYVRPSVLVDKAEKLTKDIDYVKRQKNGPVGE